MYRAGVVPLLAFAVLMLHPPVGRESRRQATAPRTTLAGPPAPATATPSVRIEHELVRLPKPAQRPNRRFTSTRMALAQPADGRAPLIVRASRALVGDGRFKPEPFPRLTR